MKSKIIIKHFILFIFCTSFIYANEIKTKATVKEVVVYTDGAQVISDVATTIPKGTSTVRIINVSQFINENTIQISGLKNISILSIAFEVLSHPKKIFSDKINKLTALINEKQREIAVLQYNIKGLEEEESILSLNKNLGSSNQAVVLDKIVFHSKHYRERVPLIKMEIYDINKKIAAIDSDVKLMQEDLQKMTSNSSEKSGEIILKLDNSNEELSLNLILKYTVSGAGWIPSYEIKAKNSKDELQFAYKAQVYQNTGEDWNNVKLTLSTGNPNINNEMPKIETHFLDFINPNIYKSSSNSVNKRFNYNPLVKVVSGVVSENGLPLPGVNVVVKGTNVGVQSDFSGKYTINVEKGKELEYSFLGMENETIPIYSSTMNVFMKQNTNSLQEVVVMGYGRKSSKNQESDVEKDEELNIESITEEKEIIMNTVTFKINKNCTIPSLETPSIIEIDNFNLEAEFEYFSAPIISENVFLTAKIKNWSKYDLLPGDASIYTDGNYAGTTFLDPYLTAEEIIISMGVDSNLVIERKQLNNIKDKSFMGSTRIVDREYEITLRNNKSTDVTVKVYDRIPLSQNKEIKVEKINIDNAQYDEKTGVLFWQNTCSPKQLVKKNLSYQIKYPKNKKINL